MRRTERLQGLRLMKFEEVYGQTVRRSLSQIEAAEVLGVSERTFRRWRDRYEADGAEGLYDRRLGKMSSRIELIGSELRSGRAECLNRVARMSRPTDLKPGNPAHRVLTHADAFHVGDSQIDHPVRVALGGSLLEPLEALPCILLHPGTLSECSAEIRLGHRIL